MKLIKYRQKEYDLIRGCNHFWLNIFDDILFYFSNFKIFYLYDFSVLFCDLVSFNPIFLNFGTFSLENWIVWMKNEKLFYSTLSALILAKKWLFLVLKCFRISKIGTSRLIFQFNNQKKYGISKDTWIFFHL